MADTTTHEHDHEHDHDHVHKHYHESKDTMNTPMFVPTPFATNYGHDGGGLGMGLGGGLIGGVLLGALLGNRNGGLFGGNGDNGGGAAVNQLTLSNIQGQLGDIKAAVPLAESQVQTALALAQSDITSQNQAQTLALSNSIAQAKEAGVASANQNALMNAAGFSNLGDKVDTLSAAQAVGFGNVGLQIAQTGWAVTSAISNDGEKTRALIQSIDSANLNRMLTTAQNEIIELRNERARAADTNGLTISMINNQNQNQLQFQQQAQAIGSLTSALAGVAQIAHATNQNIIAGNAGAVTTGAQSANPVNVRA
jgi:hypothetical protein